VIRHALVSLLAGLLAFTAQSYAQDEERIAGPLPRFFPKWADYVAIPESERNRFTLSYIIGSEREIEPTTIRMWYHFADETIMLQIRDDGRIMNPPNINALNASPDVWINQPAGGMSLSMQFEYGGPTTARYRTEDLDQGMDQASQAARRAAGMASFLAPRFKTAIFVFDETSVQAWTITAENTRTALEVTNGRLEFRPGDRNMRNVVEIEFSQPPRRVILDS
jgi:hypothetical protein